MLVNKADTRIYIQKTRVKTRIFRISEVLNYSNRIAPTTIEMDLISSFGNSNGG